MESDGTLAFGPVVEETPRKGPQDTLHGGVDLCTGRSWAEGVLVREAECLFVTPMDRPVR